MCSFLKRGFLYRKNKETIFEGNNYVGYFSSVKSSYIGKGSYIGNRCHLSHCKIGKFCSIGEDVSVICGTHPVDTFISTHPSFYSRNNASRLSYVTKDSFNEFLHTENNYLITINNDVWIGSHAKIMQGVTIGDGAIVASGCVVTRDVKPYEIIGGVPGRTIRFRFSEEGISELNKIKWWEWDDDVLEKNADYFADPQEFIKKFSR